MKVFIPILILAALPCVSAAQQSGKTNAGDCPLSYWSTTGAACYYAPDLPPPLESELKSGKPIKTRYQVRGMNWLPEPLPILQPPIPDSMLDLIHKSEIRFFPDSTIRKLMPDSTIRRLRGE
ncbi:MAG: hypothetical protein ACHQNE_05955 [Candidatus Kapaibacterium sp.]